MIVTAVAVGTLRPMGKVRPVWSVRGDRTSRIWNYDLTVDRISHGERWKSRAYDDGSLALLHRLEKGTYWDDEVERARSAIALADRREVRAARTIRQLLDTCETDPEPGEFGPPGVLWVIWEWADVTLLDFIHDPDDRIEFVADEVERNVRAALGVLHGMGVVHLDVQPSNILRVDRVWKLGDLDSCGMQGGPSLRAPFDQKYWHPERGPGRPTRAEFDLYALDQTLAMLQG